MSVKSGGILIIDAPPNDRAALISSIRHESNSNPIFVEAATGEEGLTLFCETRPDCVVVSVRLPDMAISEFLHQLNSSSESATGPSVVIVAERSDENLAIQAMDLGADDYIIKPIDRYRLRQAIDSAIEKHTLRQKIEQQRVECQRLSIAATTAEKNAEVASDAFLKVQKRLEYLLTSTPAVIYASSPNPPYDPTFVSSYITQQLGYEPSEFVNNPGFWARQIHPDDISRVFAAKEKLIKCGRNFVEYRIRHKDGRYRWLHDELQATTDLSGRPIELVGYRVDITERKQSEDKLLESEERLRIALGAASAIAFVWDAASDQVIRYYSVEPALPANRGAPESIDDVRSRIHPDDLDRFSAGVENCLNGNGEYHNLYRVVRDDGSSRWLEERGILTRDEQGNPVRLTGVSIDVTELKRSELMRLAVTGAEIGTWNLDYDTGEVTWSESCKKIFGVPLDASISREQCVEVIHPDDRDRVISTVTAEMNEKREFEIECRSLLPDGSVHWMASKGRGEYDAEGNLHAIEGATFDITKRKQAEYKIEFLNAELERRATEIQEVNRDLESFAYSVSHDLRAPLRAIDGFSRIVLSDFGSLLPVEGQQYLQDVRANTRQMGKLVDDLLLFSRLGRQAIKPQLIQTSELVQQCLDELKPAREGRQVEICMDTLPPCQADPALIKQVWLNLLSNAFKYSSKKPLSIVEIGCQTKPEGLEYFVKDNGVGFDMQYAHKLFGVFQRLHRSEDYEGTGVGLASVQRIIQRHGGRIRVEAEPDHGATFYFQLFS